MSLSSRRDSGRTVLEAVVALTLVALTTVAWSRLDISATRADAFARHRDAAHAVAVTELEQLRSRLADDLGVTSASIGSTTTFDGDPIITSDSGVAAMTQTKLGELPADVERYVVAGASDSWRRIVVIVTWIEGTAERSVRLETGLPLLDRASE